MEILKKDYLRDVLKGVALVLATSVLNIGVVNATWYSSSDEEEKSYRESSSEEEYGEEEEETVDELEVDRLVEKYAKDLYNTSLFQTWGDAQRVNLRRARETILVRKIKVLFREIFTDTLEGNTSGNECTLEEIITRLKDKFSPKLRKMLKDSCKFPSNVFTEKISHDLYMGWTKKAIERLSDALSLVHICRDRANLALKRICVNEIDPILDRAAHLAAETMSARTNPERRNWMHHLARDLLLRARGIEAGGLSQQEEDFCEKIRKSFLDQIEKYSWSQEQIEAVCGSNFTAGENANLPFYRGYIHGSIEHKGTNLDSRKIADITLRQVVKYLVDNHQFDFYFTENGVEISPYDEYIVYVPIDLFYIGESAPKFLYCTYDQNKLKVSDASYLVGQSIPVFFKVSLSPDAHAKLSMYPIIPNPD